MLTVDWGCWYHEAFLRDQPHLTHYMRKLPQGQEKAKVFSATGEPLEEPSESNLQCFQVYALIPILTLIVHRN